MQLMNSLSNCKCQEKEIQNHIGEDNIEAKSIFDQLGGTYEQHGNCLILCLPLPAKKGNQAVGIWGQQHKHDLQKYKRATYTTLLTSGKLNAYEQAEDMLFRLIKQMADREGVTEQIKAKNQVIYVQIMNNIYATATEVVQANIIYI